MRIWLSIAIGLIATPAVGASFDCKRAASRIEKAICGDPVLSRSDQAMAAHYRSALALLSADGQAKLRDNQRAFLAYVESCRPDSLFTLSPPGGKPTTAGACLSPLFEDRARMLRSAPKRVGRHVFLSLTTYRAVRVKADPNIGMPPRATDIRTLVQDQDFNSGQQRAAPRRTCAKPRSRSMARGWISASIRMCWAPTSAAAMPG